MRHQTFTLSLGLAFVLAAVGIVAAVALGRLPEAIIQVLLVFSGMFAMGAFHAFATYVEGRTFLRPDIEFNEAAVRVMLDDVKFERVVEPSPTPTWDPTTDDLLIQDASLAMAKLRIDLERELRRLAYKRSVPVTSPTSVSRLVKALEVEKIIPGSVASAIRDVLPACNQAVHGAEVTTEVAQSVLGVGNDVLATLKAIYLLPTSVG